MSYTKLAVKSVFVVFTISILAALLGYIVRVILARNLSIEDFGLFYAVFAFLGLIWTFQTLGFDKATSRFIPEFLHKREYDEIKSSMLFVCIVQLFTNAVIVAVIYFISDFLAVNFFHNNQASSILKLMSIAFVLDSFALTLKSSFQGFNKMGYFSAIDVVRMAIIIIIVLIGIK